MFCCLQPTSDIHRKENVECAKKHTRNKTITEGIVVEASTSPIEGELILLLSVFMGMNGLNR